MGKKVVGKKSSRVGKRGKETDVPIVRTAGTERVSVNITKAKNGFVVSSYDCASGKDTTYVAKDRDETKVYVNKLLGEK